MFRSIPGSGFSIYGGFQDYAMNQENRALLQNSMTSRSRLLSTVLDPRRDIDKECGYPETGSLDVYKFKELYTREPIAARVVKVLPEECWATTPEVFETEDPEESTAFEKSFDELIASLRGEHSWYQGEEGNPLWEALKRADQLSGIGYFGVLLIGLDDGQPLSSPVKGLTEKNSMPQAEKPKAEKPEEPEESKKNGKPLPKSLPKEKTKNASYEKYELVCNQEKTSNRKVLFLRSFDEALVHISLYETNPTSPRYGMPVQYNIMFNDPQERSTVGMGAPLRTQIVHWTRIVHIADNLDSSEIFGVPRMRPVYNRLYDLRKLYSGDAEMFWQGALPGLSFETHPQLGGDVNISAEDTRDAVERYYNGLQRFFLTSGLSIKSLSPQVSDPTPHINAQIEAICIELGIPKRIFMGSERGELASGQDSGTWNDRLRARQNKYLTPRVIVPLIDRLILVGVLTPPQEGYSVRWPDLDSMSDMEQAQVAGATTEAVAKYIQGQVETLIPPEYFLGDILGFDKSQVEEILEAALQVQEEQQAEEEAEREEALKQLEQLPPGQQPPPPGQQPPGQQPPPGKQPPGQPPVQQQPPGVPPPGLPPKGKKPPKIIPKEDKVAKNYDTFQQDVDDVANKLGLTPEEREEMVERYTKEYRIENYSPNQPRDSDGKFGSGGGGGGGKLTKKQQKRVKSLMEDLGFSREDAEEIALMPDEDEPGDRGGSLEDKDEAINEGIEEYKFPTTLYHVVESRKIADSIKKGGIKAKKGGKTGTSRGAYLSDDPTGVIQAGDFDLGDLHIVAVDTRKLKMRLDPEYYLDYTDGSSVQRALKAKDESHYVYSPKTIPASAIKSVKKFKPRGN